jgi:hypothetical protein
MNLFHKLSGKALYLLKISHIDRLWAFFLKKLQEFNIFDRGIGLGAWGSGLGSSSMPHAPRPQIIQYFAKIIFFYYR